MFTQLSYDNMEPDYSAQREKEAINLWASQRAFYFKGAVMGEIKSWTASNKFAEAMAYYICHLNEDPKLGYHYSYTNAICYLYDEDRNNDIDLWNDVKNEFYEVHGDSIDYLEADEG